MTRKKNKSKKSYAKKSSQPTPQSSDDGPPNDEGRDETVNEPDTTTPDTSSDANKETPSPNRTLSGQQSTMSRYISFVMLCVTIVVCGFFFYNVIKGFLLPLFLASLLVVIFRPFHEWVRTKIKGPALAAAATTSAIMLMVLVPLAGLVAFGLYEANQVIRSRHEYISKIEEVRRSAGLQKPFAKRLDIIDTELRKVDEAFEQATNADERHLETLIFAARKDIDGQLDLLLKDAEHARAELANDIAKKLNEGDEATANGDVKRRATELAEGEPTNTELNEFYENGADYELLVALCKLGQKLPKHDSAPDNDASQTPEKGSLRYVVTRATSADQSLVGLVEGFRQKLNEIPARDNSRNPVSSAALDQGLNAVGLTSRPTTLELRRRFTDAQVEYNELRTALFGGPIWKWGIELVNPSEDQIDEELQKLLFSGGATRWLPSITTTATALITGLLVGLGIMSVALFYFFMDGPKMIQAFMHLSPLDDEHELELLQEFDKVSRAVVLATLLAAVAQGGLGFIGYWIVGMESVVLLTLLTTFLALIPFVGAAAVWVPCCFYIAFIKEPVDPEGVRTWMYTKAAFLAAYGFLVVSMADNFIKPWVLQGQSKLHPLLALLSVLGGVQALGPIGILVGPMVVAFLQVLLTILQREISSLDEAMKA